MVAGFFYFRVSFTGQGNEKKAMSNTGKKTVGAAVAPLLCLVALASPATMADDFSQWLKQQQQGINQEKKAFQEYKDKRDKEFTAFLKAHWTAVKLLKGERRDETPKPEVMPVAKPLPPLPLKPQPSTPVVPEPQAKKPKPPAPVATKPVTEPPVVEKPVDRQPSPAPEPVVETKPAPVVVTVPPPVVVVPPKPAPVAVTPKGNKLRVNYYGQNLTFYYDSKLKARLGYRVDKNAISDYWSTLSRADYEPLLEQLSKQRKALQLTDWAYASLVDKVSDGINGRGSNESSLLSWFLLAKSGFKARVAYSKNTVYLLIPSQQELFEVPYFTFSGKRFYAVSFDGRKKTLGQVYTYDGEYPGTVKDLDMRVTPLVAANAQCERRHLSFKFRGKPYNVDVVYDRGRIDFFKGYPQMELPLYFSAGVEPETATPLQKQLASYIKGMDEQQAVNFLLRFVQTSLRYETDEQQFGRENYLFPEETLYYPYSDCEDRAVLFAWLVKSLLGLDVIGLDYPGHVATAVNFKADIGGDSVYYKGRKYTVADPTYINANAGMTMPDYKNRKPDIIAY